MWFRSSSPTARVGRRAPTVRRRLLYSAFSAVALVALLIGVPFGYTGWVLGANFINSQIENRVDSMVYDIAAQQADWQARAADPATAAELARRPPILNTSVIALMTPEDAAVHVEYVDYLGGTQSWDNGASTSALGANPLVYERQLDPGGVLRLELPRGPERASQLQWVGAVILLLAVVFGTATTMAAIGARRVTQPLDLLTDRAERLVAGDFRTHADRYGVAELDRIADVLDSAASEISGRLQREHTLVGDVSHQLRSRLTAIRLRLDELSTHPDQAVVDEATEAMGQVDRLTAVIEDLVRASRSNPGTDPVDVVAIADALVTEWRPFYASINRALLLEVEGARWAIVTEGRMREALTVLLDNSLRHGDGTTTVRIRQVRGQRDAQRNQGEDLLAVQVSDEGKGVSDDAAGRVFDRGYSGSGSTGVGLALARAMLEADGGRLELQRRRPPMFTMFLPTVRSAFDGQRREPR